MKTVAKVVQDPEKIVAVEVLAEQIKNIGEGVRKLRNGPLNERALILLIQHASPTVKGYPPKPVSAKHVKAVLEGLDNLEREFLKPKAKQS